MSTSDHPESDGQTERANRVLEEILRGYVHSFKSWRGRDSREQKPIWFTLITPDEEVIAFDADIDNIDIEEDDASESAEALTEDNDPSESAEALTEEKVDVAAVRSQHTEANESSDEFILARETVVRFVQDSIAEAVDKQKAKR
uniref:Integrase catalytic domain-containing protein n=1 Tax=Peronospora matthiolae TaxID=2874970 RepID=A0AAV1UX54_9STRA